jgi:hypothetical protein
MNSQWIIRHPNLMMAMLTATRSGVPMSKRCRTIAELATANNWL